MPSSHHLTTSQALSPSAPSAHSFQANKDVSKYANKDGSKFIALPKAASATRTSQPTIPIPPTMTPGQPSVIGSVGGGPPPGVNPKKQKRRQKMAAKAAAVAASAAANGHGHPSASTEAQITPTGRAPTSTDLVDADADADADESPRHPRRTRQSQSPLPLPNGVHQEDDDDPFGAQSKSKKSKKNKRKKKNAPGPGAEESSSHGGVQHYHSQHVGRPRSDDRFWNTNSNEERERIKAFWISLSEDERKNLVKLEKDTILKKMKEQQKNTCSCAVCGRKRSAIEQELEGLYDSYYRELENYANRADGSLIGGPGNFALQTTREPPVGYHPQVPPRSRLVEHVHEVNDEEEDSYAEEEYEDEDDAYSEDDLSDDEVPRDDNKVLSDFLDFGNSLQVKGGILTVADDLLKNDGRKFIEMMEQLAERRMAREENASPSHYPRMIGHRAPNGAYAPEEHGHDDDDDEHEHEHERALEHHHHHHHDYSHPHPHAAHEHAHAHDHDHVHDHDHGHVHPDDDHEGDYEDEEDDYDESQEGEYDEDEDEAEEAISDQQRMEEGRRMFQIFAARMFEQRVLSAYKKKLASERTEKLLQELAEEKRLEEEKKASKASKAAKKRDREKQKKLAAQEAKARKEAEKAAEEAAKKFEAEKRVEEQRRQVEEKRKAKEAQRKKEEEERNRKEAERLRRVQEQERRAREAREAKEREKRLKEELRLREIQDARDAKERRDRELRERQKKEAERQREQEQRQRDQKEKDSRVRKEKQETQERERMSKEVHANADRSAKDKQKAQAQAQAKASSKASPSQAAVPKGPAAKRQPQTQLQAIGAAQPPVQSAILSLPQHPAPPAMYASPKVSVATPIVPPRTLHTIRSRTSSQQQDPTGSGPSLSQQGSSTSHSSSPQANTPAHSSPGAMGPQHSYVPGMTSSVPLTGSPSMPSLRSGLNTPPPHPFPLGRGLTMTPLPPPGFGQVPPGVQHRMHQDPIFPPPQASYRYGQDITQFPPGLTMPIGRAGYGGPPPPPGFPPPTGDSAIMGHGFGFPSDVGMPPQPRQMSGSSIDPLSTPNMSAQAINRPAPIGRPASVVHGQRSTMDNSHLITDDEQEHLGSRALLDDDADDPIALGQGSLRQRTSAPGPNIRTQFPPTGFIDAAFGAPSPFLAQWGGPSSAAFSPQPSLGPNVWGAPTAGAQFSVPGVAPVGVSVGVGQLRTTRPPFNAVALRHMLCKACQNLTDAHQADVKGYVEFAEVKAVIEHNLGHEVPEMELLAVSETEGSVQNGGGSFDSMSGSGGTTLIRWVPGRPAEKAAHHHPLGAPGDIGSPVIGSGAPGAGRGS